MKRKHRFVIILTLLACVVSSQTLAENKPKWMFNTLKDSYKIAKGKTLTFNHLNGDVRIKTADTDHIQVTAIAQFHEEDPRKPRIEFNPNTSAQGKNNQKLSVHFDYLEIAAQEEWKKRRIDVGILVPKHLNLIINSNNGIIEVKNIEASSNLKSNKGSISYKGTGNLTAYSERGEIIAKFTQTKKSHQVDLSSLTGNIHLILLDEANAMISTETRGPITTDFTLKIDRKKNSPFKKGVSKIGKGYSKIILNSHSGAIRMQSLTISEKK
jgi:hypothetical protein